MLTLDLSTRAIAASSRAATTFAQDVCMQHVRALQPAPSVKFHHEKRRNTVASSASGRAARRGNSAREAQARRLEALSDEDSGDVPDEDPFVAHAAGVNSIDVDRFDGRYMISGGADGGILMWDLESQPGIDTGEFKPTDMVSRIYSSETMVEAASFKLSSKIFTHSMSPIGTHLLVACATQHPAVRLVDLRSGAATQSLSGHARGAVMGLAWSPQNENLLASSGEDGVVRIWDIRRSAASLGVLDQDDSIGVEGFDDSVKPRRRPERGLAHSAPANGLVWTEDGKHLLSTGHDEKIRVWDMSTGANTLANFGPSVRNKRATTVLPALISSSMLRPSDDIMCFPNGKEILMFDLFEGRMIKRLPIPGLSNDPRGRAPHQVQSLAWRPFSQELLSAHSDGRILTWRPRTWLDAFVDEVESGVDSEELSESKKRKREVLDEIYKDLTQPKVTFT